MAKEGSTIGGLMDCFGTAVSMSLQYGVPLEVYVNKFSHTRFEPMGFTKNPDIRFAKSIVDYIFRWLGITFLPGYREANSKRARPPRNRDSRRAPSGDTETEPRPAAMKAGGPTTGQGSAKTNGCGDGQRLGQRRRRRHAPTATARNDGRRRQARAVASPRPSRAARRQRRSSIRLPSPPATSSSPVSRPTPPVATVAARSRFVRETATSATTAATAWAARNWTCAALVPSPSGRGPG